MMRARSQVNTTRAGDLQSPPVAAVCDRRGLLVFANDSAVTDRRYSPQSDGDCKLPAPHALIVSCASGWNGQPGRSRRQPAAELRHSGLPNQIARPWRSTSVGRVARRNGPVARSTQPMAVAFGFQVALLLIVALPTFAASVGELVDDRLAVERVYYAKQVGARAPFEQAVSRSVIERRVQQELLKERVLKSVYRLEITPKLVAEEIARIQRSTMAGDMLQQIKASLGNNPERFARSVAKPLVVDRVLRARFEADATQQAGQRQAAESLRAQLLAAKPAERAALLKDRKDVREVKWFFGARPKAADARGKLAADLAMPKAYFADLHADMQKVLDAQLRQPGDVSAVFGSDYNFALYVATSRTAEVLAAQAVEMPRLNFDDWLAAQAGRTP